MPRLMLSGLETFLAIVFYLPHWSIRTTVHTDLAFDDTIVGCRFLLV